MNLPPPVTHSVFALAALIGARPAIHEPGGFPASPSQIQRAQASDPVDEGLLFPDIDADGRLTGSGAGSPGRAWMKFDNDACGLLQQIENKRTMLRDSALADDFDDGGELDPPEEARAIIGRWLAVHAEIAVVNEGIARSCDDEYSPIEEGPDDEDLAPEIASGSLDLALNRPHHWAIA